MIVNKDDARLRCIQTFSVADNSTGGRGINFYGLIDGWTATPLYVVFNVSPFHHRAWNHFCWVYSSITSINNLYHNGKLVGTRL